MTRFGLVAVIVAWCVIVAIGVAEAQEHGDAPRRGLLDLNGYYDTRRATVFTVNTWAQLPAELEYFSLVNYFSSAPADRLEDVGAVFSEQNLRYAPLPTWPVDIALQWAFKSGDRNDVLRAGLRFRVMHVELVEAWMREHGLVYFVSAFPGQLDFGGPGYRAQMEHVYRWQVLGRSLDRRLYLSGFLDHNLALGAAATRRHILVTEHQLGVRLVDELHVVAEWRRNEFLPVKRSGLGLGLQYVVPFSSGKLGP